MSEPTPPVLEPIKNFDWVNVLHSDSIADKVKAMLQLGATNMTYTITAGKDELLVITAKLNKKPRHRKKK